MLIWETTLIETKCLSHINFWCPMFLNTSPNINIVYLQVSVSYLYHVKYPHTLTKDKILSYSINLTNT